jgi:hypothetical protein
MADSPRELVGLDVTGAITFECYPRFIKGGFQDYERLGVKDPLPSPSMFPPYGRGCQEQRLLESPHEGVEFLELTSPSGDHSNRLRTSRDLRGTLDQSSNQAQEFLLLRSVAGSDEKGSDLNVHDLST